MILLKALRTEPQERYGTVEQFSDDLENYLASRPIMARKGDVWYRTRKFLRRYWLPVAAATLAVGGLSAGLLVANYQRQKAQQRFNQVRQLANKLFDIDAVARLSPGTTKARELIVGTSLEYLKGLTTDAHGDPDLALEAGTAYIRVARVQGVGIAANLGHADQAVKSLDAADDLLRAVFALRPNDHTAMFRSAQVAHDRMALASERHDRDQALSFAQTSAVWLERYEQTGGVDPKDAGEVSGMYRNIASRFLNRFAGPLQI